MTTNMRQSHLFNTQDNYRAGNAVKKYAWKGVPVESNPSVMTHHLDPKFIEKDE